MLELKQISKTYKSNNFECQALKNISLKFRKKEFVAILGPSGSGKTTLLNIIGGLDKYDSGELIINNKSTNKFKNRDWDAYRNNCIGFIFQNYNLINHINVLSNVEISMILSNFNIKKRKDSAVELLKNVGLEKYIYKKINQLSGGQMQRVAIARALINNPNIILADEPTGALDSKTSIQIMNLIKEISKDKLVIMVTHNYDLAKKYATRIIELKDGILISDSNPYNELSYNNDNFKVKKTSMNFISALKLSFNNIKTKKWRTILTAFASSIGIIGIALILAISNGFNIQIDNLERNTLSSMPITITNYVNNINNYDKNENIEYPTDKYINIKDMQNSNFNHINKINEEYIKYIKNINKNLILGIDYKRLTHLNLIGKNKNNYKYVNSEKLDFLTTPINFDNHNLLKENYDLLYGKYPSNKFEILLVLNDKNQISNEIKEILDINKNKKKFSFKSIINKELKLISNNDYYNFFNDYYNINNNLEYLYNSDNATSIKISGIIRGKKDKSAFLSDTSGIMIEEDLMQYIINQNKNSDIVYSQNKQNYNILTGNIFNDESEKKELLSYLGAYDIPNVINIYPKSFKDKNKIINYLDKYNNDKNESDKIIYTDLGKTFISIFNNIMNTITFILISFSAISLIVSSIMIGIIIYISVLERTKEIGILRALGARKKDISRIFNAETFIIGTFSGTLGILVTKIFIIPINIIIYKMTNLKNVAQLNYTHALILIILSIILTMIGGFIPSKIASKKNPVMALKSE
mgnify:CR=1 FL=1